MKKVLLLVAFFTFSYLAHAQYYNLPAVNTGLNPGDINQEDTEFPFGAGMAPGWTSIIGPNQATPVWSPVQTLPIPFDFNGAAVSNYQVSSTGVVTFSSSPGAAPSTSNTALPSASIPDSSIVVWGITGSGTNDAVVTKTFGLAPNRQHWIHFASYSYPGQGGWTYWSIVLEETTNKIYFVDQRNNITTNLVNLTMGIQVNSTTAYQEAASPNVNPNSTASSATRADNWYWEFIPGNPPAYDIKVDDISSVSNFELLASAPFTIGGQVTNLGDSTVTSLQMAYSIDGGAAVLDTFSGLSVSKGGTYNYTFAQTWNPAISAAYDVRVWVNSINFQPDENNFNDTLDKMVTIFDTLVQRLPLHESFTSSTCGPCLPGNQNLATIWNANPDRQIILKYQMSWPGSGDPYFTDEGNDRRNYYGINSVPRLEVDGQWDGNSNSYTAALRDAFWSVPSFMDVDIEYEVNCQTIDANVTVTPYGDFAAGLILHFAVIENITYNNVKSNGESVFDHVMKKMLPDANGTILPALSKGVPFSTTFSYTFNGEYRLPNNATDPINHATEHSIEEFFDLQVVSFVQDNNTRIIEQSNYGVDLIKQDVATTELLTSVDLPVGGSHNIRAVIQNWQDSVLNSLDFNYQIDNGPVETMSLSALGMQIGDTMHVTHSTPWNPTTPGNQNLKVWVSNPNGGTDEIPCNDTITATINVIAGLDNNISKAVSVFPNPSSGLFNLENGLSENMDVIIISPTGEIIDEQRIQAGASIELNLSKYSSGIYFAKLKTSQGVGVKKLSLK